MKRRDFDKTMGVLDAMSKEINKHEDVAKQEDSPLGSGARRDFLRQGAAGVAGLAGASIFGMQPSQVEA